MIYLDYSATTPMDPKVLECYTKTVRDYPGNANSAHHLGTDANQLIQKSTEKILSYFGDQEREVIFTSGATEANNLAIKGIALKKKHLGMHLITSPFEHPSVTACFGYLQNLGFEVDFVDTDEHGRVKLDHLKELVREDTILVSIAAVNSEIGIIQPIPEIGVILRDYPYVTFHSDMTQAVGKMAVDTKDIDLISFSAHKIYGPVGIGALIRKSDTILETQIHGGRSTTDYRSGTPATAMIAAFALAVRFAKERLDSQYRYHVYGLNTYIRERLSSNPNIVFNSELAYTIPQIMNLSVLSTKSEQMMKKLDDMGVIVSTQTACHMENARSESVYRLTKSALRARTCIRISLSHLTTLDEANQLIDLLQKEEVR